MQTRDQSLFDKLGTDKIRTREDLNLHYRITVYELFLFPPFVVWEVLEIV